MAIFSAAVRISASCSGVRPVEPMTRAGPPALGAGLGQVDRGLGGREIDDHVAQRQVRRLAPVEAGGDDDILAGVQDLIERRGPFGRVRRKCRRGRVPLNGVEPVTARVSSLRAAAAAFGAQDVGPEAFGLAGEGLELRGVLALAERRRPVPASVPSGARSGRSGSRRTARPPDRRAGGRSDAACPCP